MSSSTKIYPIKLFPGGSAPALKILECIDLPAEADEPLKILIAGCRYGESVYAAASRLNCSVTGIDDDSEGILFAKMQKNALDPDGRTRFRVMSAVSPGFRDELFDVVILEGILQAYPRRELFRAMRKLLKEHGKIGIADSIWLQEEIPQFIREVWESSRKKMCTVSEIRNDLHAAGFEVFWEQDRSTDLADFYRQFSSKVAHHYKQGFSDVKHLKSLIRHYRHEIDVYLKHGGRKFMGFSAFAAKRL